MTTKNNDYKNNDYKIIIDYKIMTTKNNDYKIIIDYKIMTDYKLMTFPK